MKEYRHNVYMFCGSIYGMNDCMFFFIFMLKP